jgi:hypothetical protein
MDQRRSFDIDEHIRLTQRGCERLGITEAVNHPPLLGEDLSVQRNEDLVGHRSATSFVLDQVQLMQGQIGCYRDLLAERRLAAAWLAEDGDFHSSANSKHGHQQRVLLVLNPRELRPIRQSRMAFRKAGAAV